ncbi:MAG: hypothetical protein WDN08_01300 [Rhizomicrobium sp.]
MAWALSASPLLTKLYCAPGNAGIAAVAECVPIPAMDFPALVAFAKEKKIDFAVIGADPPLVGGLWDAFEAAGIRATGPSKAAAALEGSKGFVKDLCAEYGIPTAAYRRFRAPGAAKAFAETLGLPVVIKADGLAAGKGVIVAESAAEAHKAVDFMFEGGLGASGHEVVVEEFMEGEEASFFALCDGETAIPLAGAQDHKRVFDGDKGPNTGGMGAYSPAPVLTPVLEAICDGALHRADRGGAAGQGPRLYGRDVSGPDDHEGRAEAGRIQLPLRRSRMPGSDAAAEERSSDRAARDARRDAEGGRSSLERRRRAHRRDGVEGLSRRLREGARHHPGWRRRRSCRACRSSTPGRRSTATISSRSAAACSTSPRPARAWPRRRRAPMRAVDLIHWDGCFARRDIGWRALARR